MATLAASALHRQTAPTLFIRHLDSLWLVRSTAEGGTEYVCFRGASESVEVLEGFHLPPQMPLIKRRRWLKPAEAISCRQQLEASEGFRHGTALF